MKVRNWHKRNTRAAAEVTATANLCSTYSDTGSSHQLTIRSDELGALNVTMAEDEFQNLAKQFAWQSERPVRE